MLRKESCVAGFLFAWRICNEAVRGGVVAVRTPAGDFAAPDRRYTVAHRCTANLLGRFCAGPLMRGGLCKKRQSFAQPTHGPSGSPSFPKKERTKKFTFAHKRIHLHRKPPTKGVHLYNESPQNNHLRIQNAPIPGGGYVTGLLYHPKQPGILYARTDIGGVYRYEYEKSAGKASSTV